MVSISQNHYHSQGLVHLTYVKLEYSSFLKRDGLDAIIVAAIGMDGKWGQIMLDY